MREYQEWCWKVDKLQNVTLFERTDINRGGGDGGASGRPVLVMLGSVGQGGGPCNLPASLPLLFSNIL